MTGNPAFMWSRELLRMPDTPTTPLLVLPPPINHV